MFCMRTDNIMSVKLIEEVTFFFFFTSKCESCLHKTPVVVNLPGCVCTRLFFSWGKLTGFQSDSTRQWPSVALRNKQQHTSKDGSSIFRLTWIQWNSFCKPPGLVQAPRRLTTFRWFPMWFRIFSSVIRAFCSLAVAPSGGQRWQN